MTSFKLLELNERIQKAIDDRGYVLPTPIQAKAIPLILAGQDLVACAPTGTGKTAAFILPALHLLTQYKNSKKPKIVVLTPTRELSTQITKAVSDYGKYLQIKSASLVGGVGYPQQRRSLSRPLDIIIATPGRFIDHLNNGKVDLSEVQMLILDEADRMLDMGFIDDVRLIAKACPAKRQTLLFSATVGTSLTRVIKELLQNPVRVDVSENILSPKQITQNVYLSNNPEHKRQLLNHLLQHEKIFKAIIFAATKRGAEQLTEKLRTSGYSASALHGDLKQNVRNRTVEHLRSGKTQFLVATDVAARGIDINDVTHVINYDLPRFAEDYVHRIGRTGRAGKTGIAISLVLPAEIRQLKRIEKYTGQKLIQMIINGLEPKTILTEAPQDKKKPEKKRGSRRRPPQQNKKRNERNSENKRPRKTRRRSSH